MNKYQEVGIEFERLIEDILEASLIVLGADKRGITPRGDGKYHLLKHTERIKHPLQELLDKQIPMKPLLNDKQLNLGKFMCECNRILHMDNTYCPKCGQKIDRSVFVETI